MEGWCNYITDLLLNNSKLGCDKRIWLTAEQFIIGLRQANLVLIAYASSEGSGEPGIRAVSPEPPLLAHTRSESRGTFRQKARSLAPLNGWTCAVKICHDGMLEDTNSLDTQNSRNSTMPFNFLPTFKLAFESELNKAYKTMYIQGIRISLGTSHFAVPSMASLGPKQSLRRQQKHWSDWANAQAGLSPCWVHRSFCWIFYVLAKMHVTCNWPYATCQSKYTLISQIW